MRTTIHRLLALATAATLATGALANTTLTVASFPSFDESVKLAIPLYKKVHPEIDIKLVSLSFNDHHNAMTTALATGAGVPDVMGIEISYIGKFAESKGLEDLGGPPYNGKALQPIFHSWAYAQGVDAAGELVAIPADVGPGTLFYRKDILDKAGVTIEDMTKSWENFIADGKKIREKTGAYTVTGAGDIFTVYIRSTVKPGEDLYFDKNGESQLLTPRFKKGFELALAARKADIDGKIGPWSNEWREGFRRDALATQMMGSWLAGHLTSWLNPEAAGKWRAAPLPGGAYASWGGSFYAMPKKAEHKKEAWDFIKFMTTDKDMQMLAYRKQGAYPAMAGNLDPAFINEPIAFLGGQKARLLWANATAKIPAIRVDKYDPVAAELVGGALDDVLEDGKPIDKALQEADEKLRKRVRRH